MLSLVSQNRISSYIDTFGIHWGRIYMHIILIRCKKHPNRNGFIFCTKNAFELRTVGITIAMDTIKFNAKREVLLCLRYYINHRIIYDTVFNACIYVFSERKNFYLKNFHMVACCTLYVNVNVRNATTFFQTYYI